GSVAAVQRALRPAQHFDLVHIDEGELVSVRCSLINAIYIDATRFVAADGEVQRPKPTYGRGGGPEAVVGSDEQTRCEHCEIGEVLHVLFVEIGGSERSYRLRRRLLVRDTFRGSDHDLLQDRRVRRGLCGWLGRGRG